MNLKHIIFILVYFLVTILRITISSSIASDKLLSITSTSTEFVTEIDTENSESQIELPPLIKINDNAPAADDTNEKENNDNVETFTSSKINSEVEQINTLDAQTDNKEKLIQSHENEKIFENDRDSITRDKKINEKEDDENEHKMSNNELSSSTSSSNSNSDSESIQENLTIPVFSEWTQQQQEAEKKLVELSSNSTESSKEIKNETLAKHQIVKMRQKNYAMPDCGAKILASNPEAQSTSSVLSDKDEYMLSPCTNRIWFVVELCDSIQAQRVELANFELFSSPLKSVSISLSNRFPTREWTIAGHFDAKSERGVQHFDLKDVTLFGKFVRVDLEYTNTEHYCPLSFFRIFGTSEIEAFEVENEPGIQLSHLDEEDDILNNQNQDQIDKSRDNILNRAGAAVLSIVQKAAEVLVKSNGSGVKQNATSLKSFEENCMSLSYNIICETCSSDERSHLQDLISCKNAALSKLLLENEIKDHLTNSIACNSILGFNLQRDSKATNRNFVASILSAKYIAAMCNIVAGDQSKLTLRVDEISEISANLISKKDEVSLKNVSKNDENDAQCQHNSNAHSTIATTEFPKDNVNESSHNDSNIDKNILIEGSKNESSEEHNIFNHIERQPFIDNESEEISKEINVATDTDKLNEPITDTTKTSNEESVVKEEVKQQIPKIDSQNSKINSEIKQENKIIEKDLKLTSGTSETKNNQSNDIKSNPAGDQKTITSTPPSPSSSNAPESVFLRLSNRIKILEKNMTLSTQYLEELSRRYKKQIEDLQQSYAKLQVQYESLNQSRRESAERDMYDKKKIQEDVHELDTKAHYIEVILIVLTAFVVLQSILIFVLFKRMSILRDAFVINEDRKLIQKGIVNSNGQIKNTTHENTSNHTSNRKRSKHRVRKISAPNILSRQNGHSNHQIANNSEFISSTPVLNRTASAPHKVNDYIEMKGKENLTNFEQSSMLEENDEILIPNFNELRINDDDDDERKNEDNYGVKKEFEMFEKSSQRGVRSRIDDDNDTTSTASVKTTEDQNSNSSFNFARRLSSPTQFLKLKKTTPMKMKNGRLNNHHHYQKKAKSESPPKINSNDSCTNFIHKSNSFQGDKESRNIDESLKFRKNNSFKKLFKKLF